MAAPDPQTLVFTLNGPTPYFLQLLTHQTGKPLHRASVEQFGADFTKPGNLVTNGAYMLESFVPNDKIVLKKNPNYYDAANVTDRRGAVAALRGPLGVPAPLRGGRGADLRRRPGRADGLHEGEAAGAACASRPISAPTTCR